MYDNQGGTLQQLDFSGAADARDYSCAAFNPGGDVAVLGGYNCLSTCSFNAQAGIWEIAGTKKVRQLTSQAVLIGAMYSTEFHIHKFNMPEYPFAQVSDAYCHNMQHTISFRL